MNIKNLFLIAVLFLLSITKLNSQNDPVILAYFPSWSESWASTGQESKLRNIPAYVNHVFLSFAKPNMRYVANSFDISNTGIQVPYDGCTLKESIDALKLKGIKVILSVGGETYWGDADAYNIEYNQIKSFVDDFGFAGIDWDFEPDGSFSSIHSVTNINHFKDFITNSRAIMPKSSGYIIACAPSGVGALGGQTNNDASSPYAFANRNTLTGENDTNLYNGSAQTNGINLFGFSSTGHMIPVIEAVGDKIDLIAFQGYNAGGSTNRSIMYDAYAHYANTYGFKIVAGVHYPNEFWGPYYTYTHENIASLSTHIKNYTGRVGSGDGIMIWQLLLTGANSSAYSYLNVASKVLNGTSETMAIAQANNWSLQTYTGGATGCSGGEGGGTSYCGTSVYNADNDYPTANTEVYYQCKIWKNKWYANKNELPGVNSVWEFVMNCNEGPDCSLAVDENQIKFTKLYQKDNKLFYDIKGMDANTYTFKIYNILGKQVWHEDKKNKTGFVDVSSLNTGLYILKILGGSNQIFIKKIVVH